MSWDSLVEALPPLTVLRSTNPTATSDAALAKPGAFAAVATIRGRMVLAGGQQMAMWATLGIEANYELLTKYAGIQNGDAVQYTDANLGTRTFRVKGARGQRMEGGTIDSFSKYPCQEVSRT